MQKGPISYTKLSVLVNEDIVKDLVGYRCVSRDNIAASFVRWKHYVDKKRAYVKFEKVDLVFLSSKSLGVSI